MRFTLFLFCSTILCAACEPAESVCVDVIEKADLGDEGLAMYVENDFVGAEVCFEGVATKTCKQKGGDPVSLAEYESADTPIEDACTQQGFLIQCGNVGYVALSEDCPEGYTVVELE